MAIPDNANIPTEVIDKFREKALLKPSWKPSGQVIPPSATSFLIGGLTINFADLEPVMGIFSPDAKVLVNGLPQPPKVFVFTTAAHPEVRVILDDRGVFVKAALSEGPTNIIELVPISRRTFVEVNADTDIDWDNVDQDELVVRICGLM